MKKRLLTDVELVKDIAITGFTERTIATLRHKHKIPYIKVGHRTLLYDPEAVLAALQKREVKAIRS